MIKSMTGYGRGKMEFDGRDYTVEIKTVNHRYHDVSIKMPRYLLSLEDPLRQIISKSISRGKIDVFVSLNNLSDIGKNIQVDINLAGKYISEMKKLAEKYQLKEDITVTSLMKFPDMLVMNNEIDENLYFKEIKACTEMALNSLKQAREKEGANLKEDILKRLSVIANNTDSMEKNSQGLVEEYRKKLQARLEEIGATKSIDENRLATEMVLFADKSSICEEITRLRSHIDTFKGILENDGAIGKKLDFLVQEMNREVNTIAAKANCIAITGLVIDTKNEIENIREQVQNIE